MKKMKTLKEVITGGGVTERYNVREGQMFHLVNGYGHNCVFCGEPATHRFKAQANTASIYLCTEHMVRFFHMKPNRMPPRPKVKLAPMPECMPRDYKLTRTMHKPVRFFGKRLVCHDAGDIMGFRYFFSLYNAFRTENTAGSGFYISVTGYMKAPVTKDGQKMYSRKTVGMNYVEPCQLLDLDVFLENALKWFTAPERCHPGNAQMLRSLLEAEATKFMEEIENKTEEILEELEAAEIGG